MKSLLLLALGLARTVVLGARIEAERIVVSVRPYKREQRRCPVCGRACDFYDMANRGAPRLWRAMDLARSACYLEYAPCRVSMARLSASSMLDAVSRSFVTTYAMVSVSLVVWKMAPVSSSAERSSAAVERLPLWARAILPFWWFTSRGWQLLRFVAPVVP